MVCYVIVVDLLFCFFFNDTATTEIYTLSLHDALPILSFTREDNINIIECYYRSEPTRRGYMRRMAKIWEERGGFELTESRLAMQARPIIRKEWLIQEELDEIRIRESEEQGREEELTGNVSVEVIPAGVLDRIYHGQRRQTDYTEIMDEISDLQRLPEEQQELVKEIRTTRERLQMMREKLSSIRHIDKRKIMIEVKKINDVIEHVPIDNITELNDTFYACAAMVARKLAKGRTAMGKKT